MLGLITFAYKKCPSQSSWLAQFLHRIGESVHSKASKITSKTHYLEQDEEYCQMFLQIKIKELQDRQGGNEIIQKQWRLYTDMLKDLLEASSKESDTSLTAWMDELFPNKNKTPYPEGYRITFSFFQPDDREAFMKESQGGKIRHYLFFLKSIEDLRCSNAHPINKSDNQSYILWMTFENTLCRIAGFHDIILDRKEMENIKLRLFLTPPEKK